MSLNIGKEKILIYFFLCSIFISSIFMVGEMNGNLTEEIDLNDDISKNFILKSAEVWEISPFEIDATATGVGAHNWTWAVSQPWCTGLGTLNNPYIIENLIINGGGSEYCISIRNSDIFFRIENCTFTNTGPGFEDASIKLINTSYGVVIDNNCSSNETCGIYLKYCNNNTISENIVNDNVEVGITLMFSNNNELLGNTVLRNNVGIILSFESNNNTILGNMCNDGVAALTYFSIASGITVEYDCNYNLISGNIAKNNSMGIKINGNCNNNTIEGNTFNENLLRGIWIINSNFNFIIENTINKNGIGIDLKISNYTQIIGNTLIGNGVCTEEEDCIGNDFQNNKCGESQPAIHGYGLYFILSVFTITFGILIKKQFKVLLFE